MTEAARSPFQPVDDAVRRTAHALLGEACHAALACIDPDTGAPAASRVLVATDISGDPVLLVSQLAHHTAALLRDGRASLLIGDVAAGDPLSQPRMTLDGGVEHIPHFHEAFARVRRRFLARHSTARVYAGFADFVWLRLHVRKASLFAGFARAYRLDRDDICHTTLPELIAREDEILARLNQRFTDGISRILALSNDGATQAWQIMTLDADGFAATTVDVQGLRNIRRIAFPSRVQTEADIMDALDRMTHATD